MSRKFLSQETFATICLLLSFYLSGLGQSASIKNQIASPTQADLILTTTVLNHEGISVTDLSLENFRVFIDKEPAKIVTIRNEDVPLSVGIVFDASFSAGFPNSGKLKGLATNSLQEGLDKFLALSNHANEYFLIAFNDRPQLLLDWTFDSARLMDAVSTLKPRGQTASYDACYLALEKVKHGRYRKRVLILIGDGQDNSSRYSFELLRESLKKTDVILYSISIGMVGKHPIVSEGLAFLDELSAMSGGHLFVPRVEEGKKKSEVSDTFALLAFELRHQYTLVVTPGNSDNKKGQKIKVRVSPQRNAPPDRKRLFVRVRENYFVN